MKSGQSAMFNYGPSLVIAALLLFAACGDNDPAGPPVPAGALRFRDLSAGYFHTCGLALDHKVYCWGGNDFGTLGDGTRTMRTLPAAVATTLAFSALDAGAGHNCALTANGAAYCWGHGDEGQVGDGTFGDRDRPIAVVGGLTFTQISAGHAHTCALTAAGAAYCWGDDTSGQLGNGLAEGATRSAVPVRVLSEQPFAHVSAGYYQSCALTQAGEAYCWGMNSDGQNGDGTTTIRHEPVRVSGSQLFTSLSPGDRFACAVATGGTVSCWGANRLGEIGSTAASSVPVQTQGVPASAAVFTSQGTSTITSAEPYACAVRSDGDVLCWGGGIRALRQRGAGATQLDARIRTATVAAGAEHVCVLSREDYAYCGGANYAGQLGDDTRTDRAQLVPVAGPRP